MAGFRKGTIDGAGSIQMVATAALLRRMGCGAPAVPVTPTAAATLLAVAIKFCRVSGFMGTKVTKSQYQQSLAFLRVPLGPQITMPSDYASGNLG